VRWLAVPAAVLLLAACTNSAPEPEAEATDIPEEFAGAAPPVAGAGGIGTPMDERVAVLGLLNKRNNISRELEMKPGESRRVGDVIVRLSACERTAPWEEPPETGAFVQVIVLTRADDGSDPEWRRFFSGWLFRNSPSLNVVEHPIYDVWVKDCRMSFPGEEAPASGGGDGEAAAPRPAPATPSPTPTPTPTPEQNEA
jgi:hypothetical protein